MYFQNKYYFYIFIILLFYMNWDSLPNEIIKIIFNYRKLATCSRYCATKK